MLCALRLGVIEDRNMESIQCYLILKGTFCSFCILQTHFFFQDLWNTNYRRLTRKGLLFEHWTSLRFRFFPKQGSITNDPNTYFTVEKQQSQSPTSSLPIKLMKVTANTRLLPNHHIWELVWTHLSDLCCIPRTAIANQHWRTTGGCIQLHWINVPVNSMLPLTPYHLSYLTTSITTNTALQLGLRTAN